MHIYIYDSFVNQKKYDSVIAKIETRITDLGLNGKIVRLGIMNSIYEVVENEIKKGAKTIVAVGNNNILNQAINAIARINKEITLNNKVPLGFIPVGKKDNEIAEFLGYEFEEAACNIISARRIQQLDLGQANEHYFLTEAKISTQGSILEIDQSYSIEIKEVGEIRVINLPSAALPEKINSSAKDNVLDLFIDTKKEQKKTLFSKQVSEQSVFPFKTLTILNKTRSVTIDRVIKIQTPVALKISKEKINLITGKGRAF